MALLTGNKTLLHFRVLLEHVNFATVLREGDTPWRLLTKTNSAPWRGYEPGSCMVVDIETARGVGENRAGLYTAEFDVLVGYRPAGWISEASPDGSRRRNGWKQEMRNQFRDGTLMDGLGMPLPPGADPVYEVFTPYHSADYTGCDFGTYIGEV